MISSPRRRELYSLANGMATFSVCRNNDIDGYWGLGILASYAERIGAKELEVLVFPNTELLEPLNTYQRNLNARFARNKIPLLRLVERIAVVFQFEKIRKMRVRGTEYRVSCIVSITDDSGKIRSVSASHNCFRHNPKYERQSNRLSSK